MRTHRPRATVAILLIAGSCVSTSAFAADLYGQYGQPGDVERPTAWQIDTGGDFVKDSTFLLSGFTYSLNGDSERSGFRLKAEAGIGDYDYRTDVVASGKVDADVWAAGLWLGYQFIKNNHSLSVYVGGDYQNTETTPKDPTNETRGGKFGFSTEAEFENVGSGPLYYGIDGIYSTGWDTYWARARVGYRFHNGEWVIGPEGTFLGDISFDNQRLGGFVDFPLRLAQTLLLNVSLGAGISFGADGGGGGGGDIGGVGIGGSTGDSAYFTFDVSSNF